MKLLRYGPKGQEKPGILDAQGQIRDLSGKVQDIAGDVLSPAGLDKLRALDIKSLPAVSGNPRIGPCVGRVPNVLCIGLNYSDHAKETGSKIPGQPILFNKHSSAISGPNDDVIIPKDSVKTDWEIELGVCIGTQARHVAEKDALKHVAGYFTANDVSERQFQIEMEGQWTKGKSADTFAPMGPWLVTADEVKDPQNLKLWCKVNGKFMQNGSTKTMIFGVATIISYLSRFMTLLPGDVIFTGTPPGVGLGMKPNPIFLKPGDVMELGVEGMGEQKQKVVAYPG